MDLDGLIRAAAALEKRQERLSAAVAPRVARGALEAVDGSVEAAERLLRYCKHQVEAAIDLLHAPGTVYEHGAGRQAQG